jgi:hypothetical protein
MYGFYRNHWLLKYMSGSSLIAMKVHGGLLAALGVAVVAVAVTRG